MYILFSYVRARRSFILRLWIFQRQALDNHVTADPIFESRLKLFAVIVHDYREAFKRSTLLARDQRFFSCGQMCDFLRRAWQRIVPRS